MIIREWGKDEWKTLIRTIKLGNCILMLGPDASLDEVKDGEFRPLTEILANQLAEKIETQIEERNIDCNNLAQVAHYYQMEVGRNGLEAKVETFYEDRIELTSELHKDLAELPFYFTISSSPDRMFYNALHQAGKIPKIKSYNYRGRTTPTVNMEHANVKEPLLFNLYGTAADLNSLVITENDLLDFLVAVVSGQPSLPKDVISELKDINKSFLFLGFGFKHWYLRVLLHVLHGNQKQYHSYALEKFPQDEKGFQQTILFFKDSKCKIHIYNQELKTFVQELRKYFTDSANGDETFEPDQSEDEEAPCAPTVFICHASENKDFAGFLYEKFKAAGFKAWLDKESLRGGDKWDKDIEKVIGKEIDYVVVLQSNELAKKVEGYVHKEINMALDRQDQFKRGIRFIIPVKIEEKCTLLEELEHLHTIGLSQEENVEELIKTIRRDQMKRKGD